MQTLLSGGSALFRRLTPLIFVIFWSTGFIVARFIAPYAEPLTFLLLRYIGAILFLLVFALYVGALWPRTRAQWGHAFASGILLHAGYIGCVWWAVRLGVPASIAALFSAIQPILTPVLAPMLLRERVGLIQWLGVLLGFAGLLLVLTPKLVGIDPGQLAAVAWPLALGAAGILSLTAGTLYQKKFVHSGDLRTVAILQYVGACVATLPAALLFEQMHITWNLTTISAMVWSIIVLSMISVGLLLVLIRRGEVSRSSQLIYLVPPVSALQAWAFFGEDFTFIQLIGMGVTVLGVVLASRAKTSLPPKTPLPA